MPGAERGPAPGGSPERVSERYARQVLFAPLGEAGQEGLLRGTVLLVGCGALNGGVWAQLQGEGGHDGGS